MQLHTTVMLSGQASSSKHPHIHPKVATVFLSHDVRSRLAGTKQAVHGSINATGLAYAIEIFRAGVVPAGGLFLEWHFIGSISIDLIGRHEYEDRFGLSLPGCFQQIERAHCINVEINKRNVASFVMRRLSRAMDDQIETIFTEKLENPSR